MLGVVAGVPIGELRGEWLVFGTGLFAPHRFLRRVDHVRDDPASRRLTVLAGAGFDERDDRLMNIGRRRQIPLVHPKLGAAEADHHVPVFCEPTARNTRQTERLKSGEQFVSVSGTRQRFQLEAELPRVATWAALPPQ